MQYYNRELIVQIEYLDIPTYSFVDDEMVKEGDSCTLFVGF